MIGKVKMVTSKGWGFIESNEIDFFFHHSNVTGDFKVLLKDHVSNPPVTVEFDNDPNAPSGPKAINVRIVKG
jgi:cold shock CspA family protein